MCVCGWVTRCVQMGVTVCVSGREAFDGQPLQRMSKYKPGSEICFQMFVVVRSSADEN